MVSFAAMYQSAIAYNQPALSQLPLCKIVGPRTGDSAALPFIDRRARRCSTIGLRILKTVFWAVCRPFMTLAMALKVLVR